MKPNFLWNFAFQECLLYKLVLENKKKILSLQGISQAFAAMSDNHMWEAVHIFSND